MRTGVYRFPPMDSVIYGWPFTEALKEEVEESSANSVFLLASGSLQQIGQGPTIARWPLVGQL